MNPLTEENDKMSSHPAPQHRLADLRDWLLDRIDGGEEMRGEDGLVSDFIRQIDAQDAELADLKQRLLPQFQGRAQRAEHERDGMLEKLIVHQTTIANLHDVIDGMRNALAPSATAETVDHGYDRTASLNAGHYVCTCGGGRNRHYDASQPSPTTKEQP